MKKVELSLTTEEAAMIVAALGFIRMNLTFNADKALWVFVPGKSIHYDLHQVISIEDLKIRIYEAYQESIEAHPFCPYIKAL